MDQDLYFYHPLENIEDIDDFYAVTSREHFTKAVSEERPYTYWTIELYDKKNGIRGGGGLGILAADMRRIAEQMDVPFVLITPFYPSETRQILKDGKINNVHFGVEYQKYGFRLIDTVNIKCCGELCKLEVIQKQFGKTRIVAITEPNFGELYSETDSSDHRLYQEVALGFGGYAALKLIGVKPAIMQLNEASTFFSALARLDELVANGMDFYEAVVYTRKHTLYTNHTLIQESETGFTKEQFEQYVYPNLKSLAVRKWLNDKFVDDKIKLSEAAIEIAELRSGVSKLHSRAANYRDLAGNRIKFKPITNGIDLETWVLPEILAFYREQWILDDYKVPTENYNTKMIFVTAEKIREFRHLGREILNETLAERPDQNGKILNFTDDDFIFDFRRNLTNHKRPDLPFKSLTKLRRVLEPRGAHYILTGRVQNGDTQMMQKLEDILAQVNTDDYLKDHVHYIADYDEKLAYALSVGTNASINVPMANTEACGTSWMKDVANLKLLISTHDGGVADVSADNYLSVQGSTEDEEIDSLYHRMKEAIAVDGNDFDLEYTIQRQVEAYLPIISGTRMLKEYLDYLFPV